MISAATAMPMPETGPSVNRNWIKANAVAAAIYATVGVLTFATDKLLGVSDPATALTFRGIGRRDHAFAGTVRPHRCLRDAHRRGACRKAAEILQAWLDRDARVDRRGLWDRPLRSLTLFGLVEQCNAVAAVAVLVLIVGLSVAAVMGRRWFGALMGGLQALVLPQGGDRDRHLDRLVCDANTSHARTCRRCCVRSWSEQHRLGRRARHADYDVRCHGRRCGDHAAGGQPAAYTLTGISPAPGFPRQ